ncbi:Cof-type HAD-IIB family hydrolase [Coprobacillus cateniformis]|jgi:Cof subfamily protein (haloacid dehalogenase superfamily)|uniref:Cof-type HAD-IIB family hydrolase n=1 Tax=Coprobacillus cateniformis TaxID=100884 RepID=UPI000E431DFA|nr:Cof-type HAD-IIB family hydrolase [Coprobacillus cateniformis]RGO14725.1 Cof-type HAD-IIB family hydrolase [Coprobacillus cateniformis]RGO24148.1 Cof-type HAD-IIB family hydrolase [Coprobacillus cateniformis]
MKKKIIFFDVDGTLYTNELGGITDNVKNAIAATRALGHLCFVASGRPYGYIADNVKAIGFDGYVLANGANIKYQNHDLEKRFLNYKDVKELCQNLKKKNIEYVLQTSTLCYLNKENKCLLDFYKKCNIDFKNFCFDYDEEEIMHKVVKIEVWVKDQEELDFAISCYGAFQYELHPDNHSMEIYAKDVSKATGILDVLRLLNIDIKDSYCFGDGPNDVEMFETVGHAIAMGNAIDIIKEKADEVCLSVKEDGVYYKLKDLFDLS